MVGYFYRLEVQAGTEYWQEDRCPPWPTSAALSSRASDFPITGKHLLTPELSLDIGYNSSINRSQNLRPKTYCPKTYVPKHTFGTEYRGNKEKVQDWYLPILYRNNVFQAVLKTSRKRLPTS
ncbi:unnamed protein product, partial [Nesidiocoris tenuis]